MWTALGRRFGSQAPTEGDGAGSSFTGAVKRRRHPAGGVLPGQRRAESGGRRGGRPQPVGNLAGDRCRPCLRRGREIPTLPQRSSSMTDTETTERVMIVNSQALTRPRDRGNLSGPRSTRCGWLHGTRDRCSSSSRRRSASTLGCRPATCRSPPCPLARSLRRRTLAARNGSPAHALSSVSGRLRRSAGRGGFSVVGEQRAKFGPRGPHGPPETAVRVDLPPWRAAFPASYAAISTCRRLTFNARHTRSHSQRTFASPRKLKRRKPSACLIQP